MNTRVLIVCSLIFLIVFWVACNKDERETQHDYPRVITGLVANINSEGVTFNGSFTQAGASEIVDHGFVFGTSNLLSIRDERVSLGASSGSGVFTAVVTYAMEKGKTYYVSAYAQDKNKIFYAETVSFTSMGSASPQILNIMPPYGVKGDTVVIKGKNFSRSLTGIINVSFNDQSVTIASASDTMLRVCVPTSAGKESADVFVTVLGQTAQKIDGFRYLKPVITGFSPKQAVIGDTMVITGHHFRPGMDVHFNQTKATVLKSDTAAVKVIVPACQSANASLTITVDKLTGRAEQSLTYLKPEITALSPDKGVVGDTIVIQGKNFGYLKEFVDIFMGERTAQVVSANNSSVKVVVPASGGKTTLPLSVHIDGQLATGYKVFTYLTPAVTSLSSNSGVIADTVFIYGDHFGYDKELIKVSFGTGLAEVKKSFNKYIKVVVPSCEERTNVLVTVEMEGKLVAGTQNFTYLTPEITAFEPTSGKRGTLITVKGKNFSLGKEHNVLAIDNMLLDVVSASPTELVVKIPEITYSTKSPIKIDVDLKLNQSQQLFEVISSWWQKNNFDGNKESDRYIQLGFSIGETGYVCSDYIDRQGNLQQDMWQYNQTLDSWTRKGALSEIDHYVWAYHIHFVAGNKLYANYGDDFNEYDPSANQWTNLGKVDFFNDYGTYKSNVIGNKGYVFYRSSNMNSDVLWEYDINNRIWTGKGDCGKMIRYAVAIGNKIYAEAWDGHIWEYTPETNSWVQKSSKKRIDDPLVFVIDQKIYVGFGYDNQNYSRRSNTLWEYDPQMDRWTAVCEFPGRWRIEPMAFVVNHKAYIGSGEIWDNSNERYEHDIWEFDPSKL